MSNRAHRRPRRAKAHRFPADDDILLIPAWCREASDLDHVKQETHDRVIARLGDRRTGGVRWKIAGPDQADAYAALDHLAKRPENPDDVAHSEGWYEHIRRLRALVREYGGYIVIAMAPGRPE